MSAYNRLVTLSGSSPIAYFSSPANNLFDKVIMKYMGPDMPNMGMDRKHPKMINLAKKNNIGK